MRAERTIPESSTPPARVAQKLVPQEKSRLDWAELHRRLEASHAVLGRRLAPGAEEKRKILHARARLLAERGKTEEASRDVLLEVVEFVLGPERYGIESSHIREIHPLLDFTPLPCTPAFVLGLANIRGQILSIVNLKKVFGLPEKGLTDLNKVVIVHADRMELGILADAILGVRRIAPEELHPALPTHTGIREEYLKGITKDPLVVLDVEKILSAEKIQMNEVLDNKI